MYMEQVFPDGEWDEFEFESVGSIEQSPGRLHIIFDGREMLFEVGESCEYESEDLLFYITTDRLLQLENIIEIEYQLSDSNGRLISNNILKMEWELQ